MTAHGCACCRYILIMIQLISRQCARECMAGGSEPYSMLFVFLLPCSGEAGGSIFSKRNAGALAVIATRPPCSRIVAAGRSRCAACRQSSINNHQSLLRPPPLLQKEAFCQECRRDPSGFMTSASPPKRQLDNSIVNI